MVNILREYLENLGTEDIVIDVDRRHRDEYFKRKIMESVEWFSRDLGKTTFKQTDISQKLLNR